jgi:predicted RNA-binding protein with RPS1 domain
MLYKAGQIVEGKVTGIQPYGAFVSLDRHVNGLIHISELSDGFVRDIGRFVKIGEIVRVKIIDFDSYTNQAKLSLKAVHKPHSRARRRPIANQPSLPPMKIGFQSIATKLDGWIEEAKKEMKAEDR